MRPFGDEDHEETTFFLNNHWKACPSSRRICRNLERGFRLKAEKRRLKIPEKMDQEKFYAIDMRA